MKIGTRITIARRAYWVQSIREDGSIVLKPCKRGVASDGSVWVLGDECRVVDLAKRDLLGKVVGLDPIEAIVLTPGQWEGRIVGRRNMRKPKKTV